MFIERLTPLRTILLAALPRAENKNTCRPINISLLAERKPYRCGTYYRITQGLMTRARVPAAGGDGCAFL